MKKAENKVLVWFLRLTNLSLSELQEKTGVDAGTLRGMTSGKKSIDAKVFGKMTKIVDKKCFTQKGRTMVLTAKGKKYYQALVDAEEAVLYKGHGDRVFPRYQGLRAGGMTRIEREREPNVDAVHRALGVTPPSLVAVPPPANNKPLSEIAMGIRLSEIHRENPEVLDDIMELLTAADDNGVPTKIIVEAAGELRRRRSA